MKKFVAVLLLVLLLGSTAFAETIEVMYNDIKVYINGVQVEFKDSLGNDVEPFIYNGNVYLPLSLVAEAMDVGYSWNGGEMSAYIGTQPGTKQFLLDVCAPYQKNAVRLYSSADGNGFSMAGNRYSNGFKFNNDGSEKFLLFNLNGKYSQMTFTVGHIDGEAMNNTTYRIYLDGKLAGEYIVVADALPTQYTLDLNNALSMKIVGVGWSHYAGMAEIVIE